MSAKSNRSLRLFTNVAGNFVARGMNLFIALLTVPLAIAGLGTQNYGIFAVILSVATFVTYADFGMGLAMVNPITSAEAQGDHAETREIISTTWSLLILIAGAVFLIGCAIVLTVGSMMPSGQSAMVPWFVFIACISASLPTAVPQRVLFALERNFEANLWQSAGKIASFGGVYLAYRMEAGIAAYVFAMLGLPALFGWLNTTWFFRKSRRDLTPHFGVSLRSAGRLLPQGLRYTVLQIGPYAETGFDIILVGAFIGLEPTTSYDLITRLFNYVPALAMIGIMPLWPAVASALANGDKRWFARVRRLSEVLLLIVTIVPAALICIYHTDILKLWTGHQVVFPYAVVLPLGFVAVSMSYMGLKNSMILAAEGPHGVFLVQLVFLLILIPTKVLALTYFGIAGLPITTALLYVLRYFWVTRILRKSISNLGEIV